MAASNIASAPGRLGGEAECAQAVELEGHRFAQRAAMLGKERAQVARGAVAVVGERFDDDGDAGRAAALVADLGIVLAAAGAAGLVDCALDRVLRHVGQPGGDEGSAQAGIVRRIGQARAGGHGDLAADLAEGAGALGVLPALAVHDVLELGMAGHRNFRDRLRNAV
jgi:hypothetical protein